MVLMDKVRRHQIVAETNSLRTSKKIPPVDIKALRKVASRPIKDFHVYKHW